MRHASLHQNLAREHGFEALEVEGTLPEDLIGTLYRVGPGIFERFGVPVSHPFEADGVIMAARFDGGGALGAARVILSEGYCEEQRAGRRLYGSSVSWLRHLRNMLTRDSKNTANTSAWIWQDRLYALMEGGKPTEIEMDTLATLGERDFAGVVLETFSAHPHRVASLATSFNFGVRYGRVTHLDLFALPDAGPARRLGRVELPWPSLVHDFVATETHLVFVVCPVELAVVRALLGVRGFGQLFEWKPELGCEMIVVPLDQPNRVQRIPYDPLWVWHFANGFRRGNELVFDLCRYADFSTVHAIAQAQDPSSPPVYQRMVIDLQREQVRSEAAFDGAAEFPRIDPRVAGSAHRYTWIRWAPPGGNEGIARVEPETGAVRAWTPPPELAPSEPIAVPRESLAEDDVWVLVLCHDDRRDRSCIAVLDGRDPEAGPLAQAWFAQPIPLSFHGTWLDAGLKAA
jgi:all-trans-8'-apo-beta-carotenal 15,15'-oxygenase